jgi:signal transduction histidine kinase
MRLTIRRKLFLAFLGVVAPPLVLLATLSGSYVRRARSDLDRKFTEEATTALRHMREEVEAGYGRIEDAARRFALNRALQNPDPAHLAALAGRFAKEHPAVRGVMVVGHVDASAPTESEVHKRVARDVQLAISKVDSDPVGVVKLLVAELRKAGQHPVDDPSFKAVMDQLVREKTEEILDDLRGRSARPIFDNLPRKSESTKEHLRVAMEDYFRRAKSQMGADLPPISFVEPDGSYRQFLQVPLRGSDGEPSGMLFVEVEPERLMRPQRIYESGLAFWLDLHPEAQKLPYEPEEAQAIQRLAPPPATLGQLAETHRTTASFQRDDQTLRVYAEMWTGFAAVAVAPESELYAPLFWFRLRVFVVIGISILLATTLAYYYSGRFVGAVENIKQGVYAISRGEWAQLEKSSKDELGGDLVESVNRMAMTLAERTRREEVATWRRLVRVLSHEINNTLGPVGSVAATIRDRIAPRVRDADAADDLKMAGKLIVERVDALSGFIAGYSDLAKLPDPEREKVDFNQLVGSATGMYTGAAAERGAKLLQSFDSRLGTALLDPRQIERVVINLVKNAIEAAPEKTGEVSVRTFRPGRGRLELVVEDNGPGILPEARKNLFVPYFTTKPGGTGIGLALVRQIVLGHGGVVTAEDRPGGGTLMRVVLPAAGGEIG